MTSGWGEERCRIIFMIFMIIFILPNAQCPPEFRTRRK